MTPLPNSLLETNSFTSVVKTDIDGKYKNVIRWSVRDATGRHIAEFHHEKEAHSYIELHNNVINSRWKEK